MVVSITLDFNCWEKVGCCCCFCNEIHRILFPPSCVAPSTISFSNVCRRNQGFTLKASMGPPGLTEQLNNSKLETLAEAEDECDIFNDLKDRFLSFKKNKYM